MDKISVVMPVKNAQPYLTECLQSIVAQTYKNWELIAVDDHSTDMSYDELCKWARGDDRITVIKNDKSGIIAALQLAANNLCGNFITRMDADDVMMPTKLALMYESLQKNGSGHVAVGLVTYISETVVGDGYRRYESWLNSLTMSASNFNDIYKECVVPSPCWMMDVEDFRKCGGFDSDVYPEDYDLCFRMRKAEMAISPVLNVIHQWRDHPNRTSRNSKHYADNRFLSMKCQHFLDYDYKSGQPFYLWGAGKKGKEIAKFLIKESISFNWITDNIKKQGVSIYDQTVKSPPESLENSAIIIVAIANEKEQKDVVYQLEKHGFCKGQNILPFC